MNIPCKNCKKLLKEHYQAGTFNKKYGILNGQNWCTDATIVKKSLWFYESISNLGYLEIKYEEQTK